MKYALYHMMNNSTICSLFQSERRGSVEVDRKIEEALTEMQTPDNLRKLKKAVSLGDWERKKVKPANLDFSKFEAKLNSAKLSCFNLNAEIYDNAI